MALLASIFLNDVLPIFIVASVGFLLARVARADVRTLSRVTFNALSPCLVFTLLVSSRVSAEAFLRMTALAVIVVLGIGVVARLVTLPFRLDRAMTSAFLLVVMFSNSGNYGLPVVSFAFGQAAVVQAGMPSAVLTTILALEFDVAPSFVTSCVLLSTLASTLTVTVLIMIVR